MKLNKTNQEALAFAETLTDRGEREVFQHSWDNKRWDILIPHFPAFGLTVDPDDSELTGITPEQLADIRATDTDNIVKANVNFDQGYTDEQVAILNAEREAAMLAELKVKVDAQLTGIQAPEVVETAAVKLDHPIGTKKTATPKAKK